IIGATEKRRLHEVRVLEALESGFAVIAHFSFRAGFPRFWPFLCFRCYKKCYEDFVVALDASGLPSTQKRGCAWGSSLPGRARRGSDTPHKFGSRKGPRSLHGVVHL